ncbi:single-stranded DNA-binding protein [Chryseobacterium oncorhynchi]|uniref:Single-stranded DNA-binding protein n=1 Tax=Chryseobacterium oncorhynchi TaxID=741074 RepID=A0A316WDR8_9FLAO|nr:single-stranded DNA-binding protein [Chryseobacterium oncorhynchi]PWN59565.1 hypothetical protein C1638_021420 [Chryseobacterium oncorhynchi]
MAYSLTLTGHLVADATYKQLNGERSPINFTVAINFPNKKNPEYKKCVYWIQSKENPEILNRLKKGEGVTVFCNYCDTSSYENENGTQFTTLEYVDKLVLHKTKDPATATESFSSESTNTSDKVDQSTEEIKED